MTQQTSVATRRKQLIGKVLYVLVAYALALGMLDYAVSKILAVQFQVVASSYAKPLNAIEGFAAIAAFFGRFRWFEMLLGFVEFVPCVLLMFSRTRSIGAVLLLGPTLFVTIVDFAFLSAPKWLEVRLTITSMLIANVALILLDGPTRRWLSELFALGRGSSRRFWWVESIMAVVLMSAVLIPFCQMVRNFYTEMGDLVGRPQINGRGTWDIRKLTVDGSAVVLNQTTDEAKAYFDFDGSCHITGLGPPIECQFESNGRSRTIKITKMPLGTAILPFQGNYELAGSTLAINGAAESHHVSLLLSRSGW